MRSLLAITVVTLFLSSCNLIGSKNNSNNTNTAKTATVKERFMGKWEVATETTSEFTGGPITFTEDGKYAAQKTTNPNSSTFTGNYTIKDDKLYPDGELKEFASEGFTLDGDNRMKLPRKGKALYFVKK